MSDDDLAELLGWILSAALVIGLAQGLWGALWA